MFKKMASDVLGLSDIGSVIKPADYDKVDADDYIMHEDEEKIYFLIKSKTDEYCFTNQAFIHLDGTSAISKKRTLRRYHYSKYRISDVSLETAGTVDLDAEIKFKIGEMDFSIDVHKKFIEELKDLFKSLIKIAEICEENEFSLQYAEKSIHLAADTLKYIRSDEHKLGGQLAELNSVAFEWLMESREKYHVKDFGYVFEKYINN
ncbi:PH domain-containing protein [Bacillus massiliglaciei]|uniref:PH domain-containing protein n=1 Tax=Bacillus massiliglaciei TaxID=1816693 RepID=UPI000AA85DD9|nr:PH domain-containing protein [Bacillus massiliglaciei]